MEEKKPETIWLTAFSLADYNEVSIARFHEKVSAEYLGKLTPYREIKPVLIIVLNTVKMATDLAQLRSITRISRTASNIFKTSNIRKPGKMFFPVLFIAFEDFSTYVLNLLVRNWLCCPRASFY